ncbi:unnamed protein product, partial [marine sediment metagenome]
MSIIHFLNVLNGDCSIIQHASGHVTAIDVNKAKTETTEDLIRRLAEISTKSYDGSISGNFNQKKYPVNPIEYLKKHNINSVFRFLLTHPDMDHMGGIKDFFAEFNPINFWDTENNEEKDNFNDAGPYNEEDWKFYKNLRDKNP